MEFCWVHENKTIIDTEFNFKNYYKKLSKKQRTRAYNFSVFALALTCKGNVAIQQAVEQMQKETDKVMNSIEINNSFIDPLFFNGNPTKLIIFAAIIFGTLFLKPFMQWLYKERNGVEAFAYSDKKIVSWATGKDLLVIIICLAILFLPLFLF